MKTKLFTYLTLSALILNAGIAVLAYTKSQKKGDTASLVALLPASDGAVAFDVQRFLSSALPQLLSGNKNMLADVNAYLDNAKAKTGIDLRQFDAAAVGVSARKISDKEYDFDFVAVARGTVNMPALIAAAKLAANGKYREEKVGEKSVIIFDAEKIAAAKADPNDPKTVEKLENLVAKEIAVTAIDGTTIAIGTPAKVIDIVSPTPRLDAELAMLVNRTPNSVASFAGRLPTGLSVFLPMDNDELAKNIDSIQLLYGSMDIKGTSTNLRATARTLEPAQAQSLKETLEGLQMFGKIAFGSSKSADKQVYARLIDAARFNNKANEVSMELSVAQPDMDFLIGRLMKKK